MDLELLAESCKKLKRLHIELGPDLRKNQFLTHNGLIRLAQGCHELEHFEVYILSGNSEAPQVLGENLENLCDFRMILTTDKRHDKALSLDDGVTALLSGCTKMIKFMLYLREGDLTEVGMKYISKYSNNVRWLMLGNVSDSDEGLIALSLGCPKLQKLEMRGCMFSEWAIVNAVKNLPSLRFLWVVSYKETTQRDLSIMTRPNWKIELIPSGSIQVPNELDELVDQEHPSELLAYYSLVDERPYCPNTVLRFRAE